MYFLAWLRLYYAPNVAQVICNHDLHLKTPFQGVRPMGPVQVRVRRVQERADVADPSVGQRPLQDDPLLP